jgi:hypothetical protein
VDSEQYLEHVIATLCARFPGLDPTTVTETVHAVHDRLREQAIITDHLAALTEHQAAEALARLAAQPRTTTG